MSNKTVRQALVDEVLYPLPDGYVDNKLFARGINPDSELTIEELNSTQFKGACADCLVAVIEQAVSFSEADKSVNVPSATQINALKVKVNKIYKEIGEEELFFDSPKVTFGL